MRVIEAFDKWMIEGEDFQRKSHYASDLTACRRQLYFNWINEIKSNPKTPGNILKMKFGKAMEFIFESFIKDSIEKKLPIQGKIIKSYSKEEKFIIRNEKLIYPISCKLDFVLTFEDETKEAIELKSSFGRGIVNIANKNEPKKDYLDQIFVYIKMTPYKKFNHPYFGRDNGYRCEFEVNDHEKGIEVISSYADGGTKNKIYEYNMDNIIHRLEEVEEAIELKKIPNRDYLVAIKNGEIKELGFQANNIKYNSDWQCLYCEWKDYCWADELQNWKNNNNSEKFIERGDVED